MGSSVFGIDLAKDSNSDRTVLAMTIYRWHIEVYSISQILNE